MLFSSSQESIREFEWDKLIQHYYKTLKYSLVELNYQKLLPTIADIQLSFLTCGLHVALSSLMVGAMRKLTQSQPNQGFDIFVGENERDYKFRHDMFANPDYQTTLKYLISFYDRNGFFEF